MIKTIYLDMDGVFANFSEGARALNCYDPDTFGLDWHPILEKGAKFWVDLEWMPAGKELYQGIRQICDENGIQLKVLSSVPKSIEGMTPQEGAKIFRDGKVGKEQWLAKNGFELDDIIIVSSGAAKADYADDTTILVDDFGANIRGFEEAGGHGVQHTSRKGAKFSLNKIQNLILADEEDKFANYKKRKIA